MKRSLAGLTAVVGYGRGLEGGVEAGSSLPMTLIYFPSHGTSADARRTPEPLEVGAFEILEAVDKKRLVTGALHEDSYVAVKPIFRSEADMVSWTQVSSLSDVLVYFVSHCRP